MQELSCSVACGIFQDQGSNLCPLHWQVYFYPLCHHRGPRKLTLWARNGEIWTPLWTGCGWGRLIVPCSWGGGGLLKPWHYCACSRLQIVVPGIASLMQGLQPSSWIKVLDIELCFCKSPHEAEVSALVQPFGAGTSGLNCPVHNLFLWPLGGSDTRVSTKEKKKRLNFILLLRISIFWRLMVALLVMDRQGFFCCCCNYYLF